MKRKALTNKIIQMVQAAKGIKDEKGNVLFEFKKTISQARSSKKRNWTNKKEMKAFKKNEKRTIAESCFLTPW